MAGSLGLHLAVVGGLAWVALSGSGSGAGHGRSVAVAALTAPERPALDADAEPERELELAPLPEALLVEADLPPQLEADEPVADATSEPLADPSRAIARLLSVPWTCGSKRSGPSGGGGAPGNSGEGGSSAVAGELSEAPAAPPPAPVIVAAALRSAPDPSYPRLSQRLEEQGSVDLRLRVLADGTVGAVEILHSSGFARLDDAAVEGVRSWTFRPATRDGAPIDSDFVHRVTFQLEEP